MSINQILLSEIETEQTVNQEAFVSYGKVLTCKDGIIEIAGLHDVMAGEDSFNKNMSITAKNSHKKVKF